MLQRKWWVVLLLSNWIKDNDHADEDDDGREIIQLAVNHHGRKSIGGDGDRGEEKDKKQSEISFGFHFLTRGFRFVDECETPGYTFCRSQ